MDFLKQVLSDNSAPARTDNSESAKDGKPIEGIDHTEGNDADGWDDGTRSDSAATSAAKDTKGTEDKGKTEEKADASKDAKDSKDKTDTDGDQARDEKGRFQKTVPHEALHAARQENRQLREQLEKAQQPKPPPSVLEDEDGAFNARINQATAPLQEKLFRLSVKAAKNLPGREDYEEVAGAFMEAAEKDPKLMKAFRDADDPGEYAYSVGKQIRELSDVGGDIIKYGEKKRAEGSAEVATLKDEIKVLKAEIESLKSSKEKQSKVPQSLNSEQSAAGKDNGYGGPRPLKSILS